MGQYFLAVNLDKKEYLKPHDYDNGLKLMEHSWRDNNFMKTVEKLLLSDWYDDKIVWAGDYMENGIYLPNNNPNTNLYRYARDNFNKITPEGTIQCRYIVNTTKQEYVDMHTIPTTKVCNPTTNETEYYAVHPLSLLTACGNGSGGGDYYGQNEESVGFWAGDNIICCHLDTNLDDFTEFKPNFKE